MVAPLSTQEYQKMVLLEQCSKPTSPCYYFNTGNALLVNILNLVWVHITPSVLITNYILKVWSYSFSEGANAGLIRILPNFCIFAY